MNNNPIITVLMAVFNSEKYLDEAINSVISQTFTNWELICVNDGSTDSSLEILLNYEKLDSRIKILNIINTGLASAARNRGLDIAKGEYLHMLDSDDLLSKDCLEKSYELAVVSKADLVIPDLFLFKSNINNVVNKTIGYNGNRDLLLTPEKAFYLSLTWKISAVGLLKTSLLQKYRYDETGLNGDEYTSRLLFLKCSKIVFSSGVYYYRQHATSSTKIISIKIFDSLTTDFRILDLAQNFNLDKVTIVLCKKKITANIFGLTQYLIRNKNHFTKEQEICVQSELKKHFAKIDDSFIQIEDNFFKRVIKRILFTNFKIFQTYVFCRTELI